MWARCTTWGRAYFNVAAAGPLSAAAAAAICIISTSSTGQALSEPQPDTKPQEHANSRPLRVLVTGFHDWRELEGNYWRCRDNPSCRLIYGNPCNWPPVRRTVVTPS